MTETPAPAAADGPPLSVQQWQPIETAPRDGSWILLFCPKGVGNGWNTRDYEVAGAPRVTLGNFSCGQWQSVETYTSVHDYGGLTGVSEETHRLGIEPTHWSLVYEPRL